MSFYIFNQVAGIYKKVGSPVAFPLFWKDRTAAKAWYDRVRAWPDWDRLFCHHFSPVVIDGRAQFERNFGWLDQK